MGTGFRAKAALCYIGGMAEEPEPSCGTCTVCCLSLNIHEFGKQAGVMCQHCTGTGCGIYEERYDVCKGFLCGYLVVAKLGEAWRPDRCGVLIMVLEGDKVPEEYKAANNALHFVVVGGEKAILRPGFAEYIMTLVSRDVGVYLSADSPKTLINKYLKELVAAKDKPGVVAMLLHIYRQHVTYRQMQNWLPLPFIEIA